MVLNEIIDGCDWPQQNTFQSLIENIHSENLTFWGNEMCFCVYERYF